MVAPTETTLIYWADSDRMVESARRKDFANLCENTLVS
jgi:hypothetical protein